MPLIIENPPDCEIRAAIRFLSVKGGKAAEIHRQISGKCIMSGGMLRTWVRASKEDRLNVHDVERSGRPSVITDDLVRKVDGKVRENSGFTISSLSY